ncbi:MAG: hypothetical protein QXK37_05110 [Candidatus Woesearchaeota archaeon]
MAMNQTSMKMGTILFIVLLFSFMSVMISSCKKESKNTPLNIDYKKGTEGLAFDFLKNVPPNKVFESSEFSVSANLKNKGAYDIKKGFLTIALETDYIKPTSSQTQTFALKGRSISNPGGDAQFIEFRAQTRNINKLSERHQSTIILTACYDYATEANQKVCIDFDSLQQSPLQKVCEAKDATLTDQGAPIAITKIEHKMQPSGTNTAKSQFVVHITNKGNGRPVNITGLADACKDTQLPPNYFDIVYIDTVQLSSNYIFKWGDEDTSQGIICKPNPVRLENKEGYFICTTNEIENKGNYETQLFIRLVYGYTESKSMPIEIQRLMR